MFPAISKTIAGLMPDLANAFTVLCGVGVMGALRAVYARPVATGINHNVRVFATDLTASSFTDGNSSWGHVSNGGYVHDASRAHATWRTSVAEGCATGDLALGTLCAVRESCRLDESN
jgi:hypothetical protein